MKRFGLHAVALPAAILLTWSAPAAGQSTDSADSVRNAILAALHPADAAAARMDPTAASVMSRCSTSLSVTFLGTGNHRAAHVTCPSPRWSLYVQVAVEGIERALVATRAIGMGQPIEAGDFRVVNMPADDVAGTPVAPEQALGLAAASPISSGQTITRQDVVTRLAVRNGQRVVVHVAMAGAEVTMTGTALQSGGIGQSILVYNRHAHKDITAVIARSNTTGPVGQPFVFGE